MDDYFHIPTETGQPTPEIQREGPFKVIKTIEGIIHDRRQTAVEIEQRQKRTRQLRVPGLNVGIAVPRPTRDAATIHADLIEKEGRIGGSIYQNGADSGYRFWLDTKGSSVLGEHVGDWHLEIPNPEDPKDPYNIHIETTEWELKKFHRDGRPYVMTIQDLQSFVPAAYHYARETLKLYPFDEEFEDILSEPTLPDAISNLLPGQQR